MFIYWPDLGEGVEQRAAGHAHVVEPELAVVDAVAAHLVAHVLDRDTGDGRHVGVADAHQEAVDAVVGLYFFVFLFLCVFCG